MDHGSVDQAGSSVLKTVDCFNKFSIGVMLYIVFGVLMHWSDALKAIQFFLNGAADVLKQKLILVGLNGKLFIIWNVS